MNLKKLIISSFAFSPMLIAGLVAPASAAIDELLMYPGATCTKLTGGTPTLNSNGRLVNNTTSNITVLCPTFDNGTNFTVSVWVIDNSSSANISCSARAENPLSGSGTQTQTTSGFSSDAKQLNFTGPTVGGTFTYRFYVCTLPPGTILINYRGRAS